MAAPKSARGRRTGRRVAKKNVAQGHAYIKSTFNHTIVSITDPKGAVISWASSGHVGFTGSRKSTPFAAQMAAENAALVNALAKLPFTAFGEGTDKGLPNRAKPEIWKDAAKFKAASEKMIVEVGKLDAAAKAGNLDAIKAAMGAVGGSCKACHDDFRAERYSAN